MNYHAVLRYHYITTEEPKNIWEVPYERYLEHLRVVQARNLQVWITFDDGWMMPKVLEAVYSQALNVGKRVTAFLCSDLIGKTGQEADTSLQTRSLKFMSEKDVNYLVGTGVEIGSHGKTHIDFIHLTGETLRDEVLGSRVALQARFNQPISTIAYPSGFYNSEVQRVVQSAGYTKAFACEDGDGTDFAISRVGMYNRTFDECIEEFTTGERAQRRKQ